MATRECAVGFFDGDASIFIPKSKSAAGRLAPLVHVFQSCDSGEPPELNWIKSIYGGTMHLTGVRSSGQRKSWYLCIREARPVLEDIHRLGIVKRKSAEIAINYLDGNIGAEEARSQLSKERHLYHVAEIHTERLTDAYISGLFVAEGSVGIYSSKNTLCMRSTITQTGCPPILDAIVEKMGCGFVSASRTAVFTSNNALDFLRKVEANMPQCQKELQVKIAIDFQKNRPRIGRKRKSEEMIRAERDAAERLKELKKQ